MFPENVILGALTIFLVRVLSIAISTVRVLIMGRANNLLIAALAFTEALMFALTFGQVASNLGNLWNLGAYSLGFAAGTWVGMLIEERVVTGYATVNVVSMGKSLPIAEAIRAAGFGATRTSGEGTSGTVGLVHAVVNRRDTARIVSLAQQIDPKAFVTVEETRRVSQGFLGYGKS
jgi:uncharacterized protein YebE (UPF0316 family)